MKYYFIKLCVCSLIMKLYNIAKLWLFEKQFGELKLNINYKFSNYSSFEASTRQGKLSMNIYLISCQRNKKITNSSLVTLSSVYIPTFMIMD